MPPAPTPTPVEPTAKRSPEYQRGYKEGVARAEREIAGNHATIYVSGMRPIGALDRETGLNTTEIGGCVTDDGLDGRADGHNDTIRLLIKSHGLPTYSRKRREEALFALSAYFEARAPADIEMLRIGGRDVTLGKVRLSARPDGLRAYVNGARLTTRTAYEIRTTIDVPITEVPSRTEVTLGPEGADTVFFRWTFRSEDQELGALDTRNGDWLRRERTLNTP